MRSWPAVAIFALLLAVDSHAAFDGDASLYEGSGGALTYVGPNSTCEPPPAALNATKAPAPECPGIDNFSCVLEKAMGFFEAQRSGKISDNLTPWRGDTGLNDTAPNGAPLVGGWFDGGDTSKFLFPGCWALCNLAWAFLRFPEAFAASNTTQRTLNSIKHEADFVVAARYEPGALVAYTSAPGGLKQSHDWWGRAEDITSPAVVNGIKAGDTGSDLLAACSAALAASSLAFEKSDPALSQKYLDVATDLFDQARDPASWGLHTKAGGAVPELQGFYNSTSWQDDMAWAAAWLAWRTSNASMLEEGRQWYAEIPVKLARGPWYSWDTVTQAAGVLLAQIQKSLDGVADASVKLHTLPARLGMADWMSAATEGGPKMVYTKKGGIPLVTNWGNMRYVMAQAFIGLQLASFHSLPDDRQRLYACFSQQMAHQALGESGQSFVVGVGSGRQACQVAHRGSSCSADSSEPCDCRNYYSAGCNPITLTGTLIGGTPLDVNRSAPGTYVDSRLKWDMNEPALDYQVSLVGALAGMVALSLTRQPVGDGWTWASWPDCLAADYVFPLDGDRELIAVDNDVLDALDLSQWHRKPISGMLGAVGWDPAGLILIAGFALAVLAYHGVCWATLLLRRRKQDPLASGMFRLAAARNDVRRMDLIARHMGPRWASPDAAAVEGFTPLHAAAVQGHAEAIKWLCERGADVAACREDGWSDTALHYAAGSGSFDACETLLAAGADPTARNFADRTPADVARAAGHAAVASALQAARDAQTRRTSMQLPPAAAGADGAPQVVEGPGPRGERVENGNANGEAKPKAAPGRASNGTNGTSAHPPALSPEERAEVDAILTRGFEGWGTPGTRPTRYVTGFRVLAATAGVMWATYLTWRALRTLGGGVTPWYYFYSMPFWLAEAVGFYMMIPFAVCLWWMQDRDDRDVRSMRLEPLPRPAGAEAPAAPKGGEGAGGYPTIDILVVCYSEPLAVIEPTVIAALNQAYPGGLNVYVCDDGSKPPVAAMVEALNKEMRQIMPRDLVKRRALHYVARKKVKGTPHHAKAGNINSCLLLESHGRGDYVLVLDCDMILATDFLSKCLGHFYMPKDGGAGGDDVKAAWVPKEKMAFLQTPQEFYNVHPKDHLGHGGRLFYGPQQQGRDGAGAVCCCGTGVMFRRDALVSCGGFSYGSITEDNLTSQALSSAGFGSAYLDRRLVFGLAPDDVEGTFTQKLRWTMGALQILSRANPLCKSGMNFTQRLLYFDSTAYAITAPATVMLSIAPLVFLYTGYSPFIIPVMWELALAFGTFHLFLELAMWQAHRGAVGGGRTHWRGTQCVYWLAPNHIKAMGKVIVSENRLLKWLCSLELGFVVTNKDAKENETHWQAFLKALPFLWPHLLYMLAFAVAVVTFVVRAAVTPLDAFSVVLGCIGAAWGAMVCVLLSPPLATLLPWSSHQQGWEVGWQHPSYVTPAAAGQQPPSSPSTKKASGPLTATGTPSPLTLTPSFSSAASFLHGPLIEASSSAPESTAPLSPSPLPPPGDVEAPRAAGGRGAAGARARRSSDDSVARRAGSALSWQAATQLGRRASECALDAAPAQVAPVSPAQSHAAIDLHTAQSSTSEEPIEIVRPWRAGSLMPPTAPLALAPTPTDAVDWDSVLTVLRLAQAAADDVAARVGSVPHSHHRLASLISLGRAPTAQSVDGGGGGAAPGASRVAARPDFSAREVPVSSFMMIFVDVALLVLLIVAAELQDQLTNNFEAIARTRPDW